MRDYYPKVYIFGDTEDLLKSFCNCLRFSTHCNFVIVSPIEPIVTDKYEHFRWIEENNFKLNFVDEKYMSISVNADGINFSRDENISLNNICSEELNVKLKSYIDSLVTNEFLSNIVKLEFNETLIVDALIDFDGDVNVLSAIKHINNKSFDNAYIYDPTAFNGLGLHEIIKENLDGVIDKLFSIEVRNNKDDMRYDIISNINKIYPHWECYRAFGINVPLIIVQNLLCRKIKTYHFVDRSNVIFSGAVSKPKYDLDYDTIYFDLDETLICKDRAIEDIVSFMREQINKGISAKLITKHTFDISKTLSKIGLSENIFKEIIIVKNNELKSYFISGKSIFIDNEFSQRLDVRKVCSVPVLDLDQIDFF